MYLSLKQERKEESSHEKLSGVSARTEPPTMILVLELSHLQGLCLLLWHTCIRATDHTTGSWMAFSTGLDAYDTEALAVALKGLDDLFTSVSSEEPQSYFKRLT